MSMKRSGRYLRSDVARNDINMQSGSIVGQFNFDSTTDRGRLATYPALALICMMII